MIRLPLRGVTRGKIRPWDGCMISIRVKSGQVGCTSSAFVMCRRSRVRGSRAPWFAPRHTVRRNIVRKRGAGGGAWLLAWAGALVVSAIRGGPLAILPTAC
jgi:hypothetical protein